MPFWPSSSILSLVSSFLKRWSLGQDPAAAPHEPAAWSEPCSPGFSHTGSSFRAQDRDERGAEKLGPSPLGGGAAAAPREASSLGARLPSNTSNVSSQGGGTGGTGKSRTSSNFGVAGLGQIERSSVSLTGSAHFHNSSYNTSFVSDPKPSP